MFRRLCRTNKDFRKENGRRDCDDDIRFGGTKRTHLVKLSEERSSGFRQVRTERIYTRCPTSVFKITGLFGVTQEVVAIILLS